MPLIIHFFVMMTKVFNMILIGIGVSLNAQYTVHPKISLGYDYHTQSFGEVGGKILFLKKDEIAYRLGGAALLGSANGKMAILPKLQADILFNFRENVDVHQGFYYMVGAESSTKHFAPYVGISALGVLDFTGGYAFSYPSQTLNGKEIKGLKLGISLNIPLSVFEK